MALNQLHNGVTTEKTTQGIAKSISYVGTKSECETWFASHPINESTADGKLVSVNIDQYSGTLYRLTVKYLNANGDSGSSTPTTPPDYSYGTYSAQLNGSMLSTPLEQHPDYKMCWNYFLAARDDASSNPQWWANVTTPILGANAEYYKWLSSPSELPVGFDSDGHYWSIIKYPTMPGVQNYDVAAYTQTESARFRSYALAAAAVAGKLNKVFTHPTIDPGFTGGSWKCDGASVSWTGDYWLATLTYTYSKDGWNTTLYNTPVNP